MPNSPPLWAALLLLAAVLLLIFLVRAPRKALMFLLNAAAGIGTLFLVIQFGSNWGIDLALNGWTSAISVLLGLPGVLALSAISMIL